MPRYEVTSPDGRKFEVNAPDGATQADAIAYIQSQFKEKPAPEAPLDPTADMSMGQKLLAGVGKGMVDLGRGAGQMLGMVSPQDVAESRKVDAPLMNTGAGMVGNIAGSVVPAAAAMFIPGANTVVGSALMGGALSGLQPTTEDESRLKNMAIGAGLGGAAQAGLGKLAQVAGDKLAAREAQAALQQSQNAVRDATLKASQDAGYAIPPSLSGGGTLSRLAEGLSGKYKTNQAAAIKNQNVTDALARKALGMAEDAPLTSQAMQGIRDAAYQTGYVPITKFGAVETDRTFKSALDDIVRDYQGASRSFPQAADNAVVKKIDSLRTGVMDTGDALAMTRILRDEANKAYASGDKALGIATKKASNAIEDQIERALVAEGKNGADALKAFRDARTLMAKTYNVEKALVAEGGNVNAKVLGAALQKGKPLSDELRTIGAFANNFKDVAGVPQSGWANPITALDAFGAAGMAGMGAGPLSVALPAARMAARKYVTSGQFSPTYGPGMLQRLTPAMLDELEKRGAGGLLGSVNARQ